MSGFERTKTGQSYTHTRTVVEIIAAGVLFLILNSMMRRIGNLAEV